MRDELKEKTKEWMALERKTLEQRREANLFYESQLMTLIEEEFIQNNSQLVFESVDCLIMSVGTSYEPIVLSYRLFQPDRVLFLFTEKSEQTLGKVIQYCGILPEQYEKRRVDETDPMDIYREIKQIYLKWDKPSRMYIDFTGGTKAMSASCALAGAMIDVQMVYVSSNDYLVDFRKPNPGSEELTYIENPVAVFGDLELHKAMELFLKYNFSGAAEKLRSIKDKVPDPEIRQQLHFLYLLSLTYENWDALDFENAYQNAKELDAQIRRDARLHKDFILMDYADMIHRQSEILERLKEIRMMLKEEKGRDVLESNQVMYALMFTMYMNGKTREEQEKYDMATLLFYRLLEMIEQKRLIRYHIFASAPEYSKIRYAPDKTECGCEEEASGSLEGLKDRYYEIKTKLFKNADRYLPPQIALLDGFILLAALDDPVITAMGKDGILVLKRIRAMLYLRNNSIFAHGLGPVGKPDYEKFRDFVTDVFRVFCKIEKIDFEKYAGLFQWINPMLSKNYISGWEAQ